MRRVALVSMARCGTHFLKSQVPKKVAFCTEELFWKGFPRLGFYQYWYDRIQEDREWLLQSAETELIDRYFQWLFESKQDKHLICDIKIEQIEKFRGLRGEMEKHFDGFILLKRENALRVVLSRRLMHDRLKQGIPANSKDIPKLKPMKVNAQTVKEATLATLKRLDSYGDWLKGLKADYYELTYEQMVANGQEKVKELLGHFGLPNDSVAECSLQKQNPYSIEQMVVNADELRDAMRSVNLEHLFD